MDIILSEPENLQHVTNCSFNTLTEEAASTLPRDEDLPAWQYDFGYKARK